MNGATYTIVVDHLPEILAQLPEALGAICKESAEATAKTYEATAPRDTGFMASSAYVRTKSSSTYGQNLAGDGPTLPEVDAPSGASDAVVAVAASYAAYPELGTVHQAAQPAFMPAFDGEAPNFQEKLAGLESRIRV